MRETDVIQCLQGCRLPTWETLPDFGLYMDQLVTYVGRAFPGVSGRLEVTSNMINNYVKAGLIDKPTGKKYSRESLAQLLMVCMLKPTTPLDVMKALLHPADGMETKEMYCAFRDAQDRIVAQITGREGQPALHYALESASLQMVLRLMIEA